MTNPMSKTDRASLSKARDVLTTLTRNKRYHFNLDDLLLLFWDEQTVAMVNTVRCVARRSQLDSMSPTFIHPVTIEHPVFPSRERVIVDFKLEQPSGTNVAVLWPKEFEPRADCNQDKLEEFQSIFQAIAEEGVERGLFIEVTDFLIQNCATFEAMSYLFPPALAIMQRAGYREIANECEKDGRAPKLPAMTHEMRTKIRHVIQWFAIQELLGTWESMKQARSDTSVEVTLWGNTTKVINHADGNFVISIE